MAKKITKHVVDTTVAADRDVIVWDTEVTGFGLRCRQAGGKFYIVKYRADGQQRWLTIGRHGSPWTPETARKKAKAVLGSVAEGKDPAGEKVAARRVITVSQLCDLYLEAAPTRPLARTERPKKASTLAFDRGRIERHIKPLMGHVKVTDVTTQAVGKFLRDVADGKTAADIKTGRRGRVIVKGGKGAASRTVGLLGGIFSYAIDELGLRSDNPVQGVTRFADRQMERYLTAAELERFGETLTAAEAEFAVHERWLAARREAEDAGADFKEPEPPRGESPVALDALRLLICSGCRKAEVLTLRRSYIDWTLRCARLPDSKTGAKVVQLGEAAIEVLRRQPEMQGNPYFFPGHKAGHHLVGLQKIWARVRDRAGLVDVRIHDLRHTFASTAAAGGDGLLVIGKLLGHRDARTTQRYAHLVDSVSRDAAQRTSGRIETAMRRSKGRADSSAVVSTLDALMASPTAAAVREFGLGDILSITAQRLVSPAGAPGVRALLEFMAGGEVPADQVAAVYSRSREALLEQHPDFATVDAVSVKPGELSAWLADQMARFGERLAITSLAGMPTPRHEAVPETLAALVG